MTDTLRPIGQTGLFIPSICFGTSALGNMPETYGYTVESARATNTVKAILQGPMPFLDTSRNYGAGKSEDRIGTALRTMGGLPDGAVISTKLDRCPNTGRFDAARARDSLGESLEALGLDRIQLLHLHDPEHARDLDECHAAIEALFEMKAQGLAQAVGLAMGRLDIMEPVLRAYPFDALINHNRFTLLNRSADAMFTEAKDRGIAILNAAPFAGGVLAKGSLQMPKITYQDATESDLAPVRAIEAACAKYDVACGAVALQFSMRDPRVTSTIVGVSRPERVAQALDWAAEDIPEGLWDDLEGLGYVTTDPEANRLYTPG